MAMQRMCLEMARERRYSNMCKSDGMLKTKSDRARDSISKGHHQSGSSKRTLGKYHMATRPNRGQVHIQDRLASPNYWRRQAPMPAKPGRSSPPLSCRNAASTAAAVPNHRHPFPTARRLQCPAPSQQPRQEGCRITQGLPLWHLRAMPRAHRSALRPLKAPGCS